jgi:cytochrome c peroxidase
MKLTTLWCVFLFSCLMTGCTSGNSHRAWGPPNRWSHIPEASREAAIALGRQLFFDAGLSGRGHTACATCHHPDYAYGDPRPVSISDDGQPGLRNAPSLLNVGFRPHLMWDGRFGSLEEQVFGPFRRDGEMGIGIEEAAARISGNPNYRLQFFNAFGRPPSPDGIAQAVAAFERTLVIGNSRFDRFMLGRDERALSPLERLGFEIFTGRGRCASCHAIFTPNVSAFPLFSDFRFRNIGIGFGRDGFRDAGRAAITFADEDYGSFRTPSLRNVAVTGPYMHDGSLRTLEDVVAFYDAGGQPNPNQNPILRPLYLNEQEKVGLVAFLHSLTELALR